MIKTTNSNDNQTEPKTKTKSKKRKKENLVTFWASDDDVVKLDSLAEATGMNKSQLIRFAIATFESNYIAALARRSEDFKSGAAPSPFVEELPLELSIALEQEIAKV